MDDHYYAPSGKAPVFGIVITLIISSSITFILATLYSLATWFIPFVYINFFITIGLGFGVGMAVTFSSKPGKIRSPRFAQRIGLLIALLAIYAQWAIYVSLLLNAGDTTQFGSAIRGFSFTGTAFNIENILIILQNPLIILEVMGKLYEHGSWGMFGIQFSGVFLALVWGTEALIILVPIVLISDMQASQPFSESDNSWLIETQLKNIGIIKNTGDIVKKLKQGMITDLLATERVKNEDNSHAKVILFTDKMENEVYISILNVSVRTNKEGEKEEKEREIVNLMKLSKSNLNRLRAQFP